MILEKINKPNDIKQLSPIEYNQLADEIRRFLIEKISKTGGHLALSSGCYSQQCRWQCSA